MGQLCMDQRAVQSTWPTCCARRGHTEQKQRSAMTSSVLHCGSLEPVMVDLTVQIRGSGPPLDCGTA